MSLFSSTLVRDQLYLSMSSIDGEYLHKSQGSVVLHNVVTGESSEFLSKDQFVSPSGSSRVCVDVCQTPSLFFQHRKKRRPLITSCLLTVAMLRSWATVPRYTQLLLWHVSKSFARPQLTLLFLSRQVWRHSFTASYSLYHRTSEWVPQHTSDTHALFYICDG